MFSLENEDMAVRLTAAKSLKKAIDDFEFDAAQFSEYVEPFVSRIFHLLKEAKECETKVCFYQYSFEKYAWGAAQIVSSINLCIPRVGD